MNNKKNKFPWRYVMRTLSGRGQVDSSNTFTYSDRQVVAIFRFGVVGGMIAGALLALALVKAGW